MEVSPLRNNQAIVFITIPLADIKKYFIFEFVTGSVIYLAILFPFHSFIAASAGSMFGPTLIRQSIKFVQNRV